MQPSSNPLEMDMDSRDGSIEPDESFSPPLVRDNPDSGNKSPYTTGQLVTPSEWDLPGTSADSHDSTSASSSSDGPNTDMNRDNCERVIEQWRLIRLANKNKPKERKVVCLELESQKEADMTLQIYPYHGVYTAPLGRNYSKFFEAFRQGLNTPPANKKVAGTVPAKRSAPSPDHPAKRTRQEDTASLQPAVQDQAPAVQHQARATPAKRAATTNIEPVQKRSKVITLPHPSRNQTRRIPAQEAAATTPKESSGPKPKGVTASLQVASESPVTPRPRSEAKGKSPSVMIPATFSKLPEILRSSLSMTKLLIVPFGNRSAFQAERRRSLCGKVGIRYRRGEGTRVFECCAKHCGL